jgi:hypothetical protein
MMVFTRSEPTIAGPALRILARLAWLALGLGALAFAIVEVVTHGLGPIPIVWFLIMPDLAFLVGIGQPHDQGQLPARAVPLYNLLHRPALPLALFCLAALAHLDLFWFAGGLAWLAHVAIDRAAGYGLRIPDGWQRRG